MLKTPVLLLVFNRPELTDRVLAAIRADCPQRLFVAADGPRSSNPGDFEKCQAVRRIIQEGINWKCDVKLLFRDQNLGCKMAVSSAITWFFDHVEQGIILEDDTLPAQSFFQFCQQMLERYRDNSTVWHVSGDNFQFGRKRGDGSYYFSVYSHVWGWATWRRAWQSYDVNMQDYPARRLDGAWQRPLSGAREREFWLGIFDRVQRGEIDTWDYQWLYAALSHSGLCIMPNVNLVSNIGCGTDATHTHGSSPLANLPTGNLDPMVHPSLVVADRAADLYTFAHIIAPKKLPLVERMRRFLWARRMRAASLRTGLAPSQSQA